MPSLNKETKIPHTATKQHMEQDKLHLSSRVKRQNSQVSSLNFLVLLTQTDRWQPLEAANLGEKYNNGAHKNSTDLYR